MAYVINLDEYKSIGTHSISLYENDNNIIYFDNFWVEHIPKEILKIKVNKNMITNICRIQAYDLIMCGYFCTYVKSKSLFDYTNLFFPNDYGKNDKIMLKYFQ